MKLVLTASVNSNSKETEIRMSVCSEHSKAAAASDSMKNAPESGQDSTIKKKKARLLTAKKEHKNNTIILKLPCIIFGKRSKTYLGFAFENLGRLNEL